MKKISGLVGIIGAGVLGQAIARQLVAQKLVRPEQLWAVTKSTSSAAAVRQELGIKCLVTGYEKLLQKTGTIILAVKPAQARSVAADLSKAGLRSGTTVISVVTGVKTSELATHLPTRTQIVRVVTNTPLLVGEGLSAIAYGTGVSKRSQELTREVCAAFGKWLEIDEAQCEAMTGLAASGPAYLYLIMEALADGGVRVGLSRTQALSAVSQMVLGAAHMVQSSGQHPASLRDDVTTPAGCTIAGLLVMEDGKIRSTLARAVEEATATAKNLGNRA